MMDYNELKRNAVKYLLTMREEDTWRFRFSQTNPLTLLASAIAAMCGRFLGYTQTLSNSERSAWAQYLNSCQNEDGWFEDEDIDDDHRLDWYGRDRALLHRTRHALCALYALGQRPARRLRMTETWIGTGTMAKWLETLDLSDYWYASNMMMDAFLLLADEYYYGCGEDALRAIHEMLDSCDRATNPNTGYQDRGLSDVRNAMAGAMHLFPVYFLCHRKPRYPQAVVETTLGLQQEDGLFGYESGTGGEDCLDYDGVLILSNFYFLVPEYRNEIKESLARCQKAIMVCLNEDGGFTCHRRREPANFGSRTSKVEPGHSSVWATYGRLLAVAMAAKVLDGDTASFTLGNGPMEVWDGGTGKMMVAPPFSLPLLEGKAIDA